MGSPRIQRALISVSDKMGLAGFARGLAAAGVEIFSTGGTRKHLESEGIAVRDVSEYTGFPEMMDGRLKTLHPKVHGGILCRHDNPEDMKALAEHGILTFELVVVNLYPFEATVARKGVTQEEAIEQIDIGGPTLVRAAAKNHAFTTIATDAAEYSEILDQITAHGCTTLELRRRLAGEAFAHTARYDRAIADFFAGAERRRAVPRQRHDQHDPQNGAPLRRESAPAGGHVRPARRPGRQPGRRPAIARQGAFLQQPPGPRRRAGDGPAILRTGGRGGQAQQSLRRRRGRHALAVALQRALDGDPLSAFGSVLGLNRTVDAATAEVLAAPGLFVEAILAPHFHDEALEILTTQPKWKNNVRLMEVGDLDQSQSPWTFRCLDGGMLMQEADVLPDPEDIWHVVTDAAPTDKQMSDLRFAWEMVRHVRSNAIVLCKDRMLLGAGAGQMSRVDSVEIAVKKAGDRAEGSVMASDAFFPFPDSIDQAAAAGVAAIIQPGGSKNDEPVIAACNRHGIPMIFTGRRHFKH